MLVPVLMLVPTNVCLLLVVSVHNTDYEQIEMMFWFVATAWHLIMGGLQHSLCDKLCQPFIRLPLVL